MHDPLPAEARETPRTRGPVAAPAPATAWIGVLAEPRYLAQREPRALAGALAARGARVELAIPAGAVDALAGCDAVVARGRSAALLEALAALEARGVPVMNRPAAIAAVVDKAHQAAALAAGGVPSPRTLVVPADGIAAAAAALGFPAIVKPVFGDNGRGIAVVASAAQAAEVARTWPEPRALVQPFLPSGGTDTKLYAAGGRVWAVEKASPLADDGAPARSIPLPPGARALALRCGALFGLDLFGVDCVATPDGLAVIEVNDFPNYSAMPEADDVMAALVLDRARREGRAP